MANFMLNNRITVAALVIAAGLYQPIAQAAAVSATAQLFSISTSANSPTLRLFNNYFTQDAVSNLSADTFNSGSTAQDITLNASIAGSTVTAESSWSSFNLPNTNAGVLGTGQASSLFQWSFDWAAGSAGQAEVDFEYNYNATIANLQAGETAGVSARLDALVDGVPFTEIENIYAFTNINDQRDGLSHLLLKFDVSAGQQGSITLTAASQAFASSVTANNPSPNTVPVPGAFWLFGSALSAYFGLLHRKKVA